MLYVFVFVRSHDSPALNVPLGVIMLLGMDIGVPRG